jgi:hypothetical protein
MENMIIELKYRKNPNIIAFFNVSNIILIIVYLFGVFASIYFDDNYQLGFFTLLFFILISIITVMYSPVFERLSQFNSLKLYKDKIVINNSMSYPIEEIFCSVKDVKRGSQLISASWTSCIFYDKNNVEIGEFFFSIGIKEVMFDAAPESIKEIIQDLKVKKEYDYKKRIQRDLEIFLTDKKSHDIAIFLLIGMLFIPVSVVILLVK